MLSDGPPSREEVTTSRTWPDSVDVKTLISSGMIAPASGAAGDDHGQLPPEALVGDPDHLPGPAGRDELVRRHARDELLRDDERQDDRDDRRDDDELREGLLEVHLVGVERTSPSRGRR